MLLLKPACIMLLFTVQCFDLYSSKDLKQLLNVAMHPFCPQMFLSLEWTLCRNIGISGLKRAYSSLKPM